MKEKQIGGKTLKNSASISFLTKEMHECPGLEIRFKCQVFLSAAGQDRCIAMFHTQHYHAHYL
jgi:hypothetical protein